MARKPSKNNGDGRPTEAELELLQVLWNRGPATVRELHDAQGAAKGVGYTSTLKIMQNMAEKGLVTRDETSRSHVYAAAHEPETTQRKLVRHLLRGAFGGSSGRLVMQALSENRASDDEVAEIRALLDEWDQKREGSHS